MHVALPSSRLLFVSLYARDRALVPGLLPCVWRCAKKKELRRRGVAGRDKRNSTYLAYFSAYVLPELVETSRQGHLVTASHSILARQFVKNRVPDVIALKQIPRSIIPSLTTFLKNIIVKHERYGEGNDKLQILGGFPTTPKRHSTSL